ncbi:hypothetical protein OC845_000641 [Tilletia horrida]|nr:hypothetical protein OC845_000641 [Tilletia horrida]
MSLYPAEHTEELKAWLTSELEPICDADPDVLADYVLALLKHPGGETELRSMVSEQLSDFLGDQTRVFVENVFTGLKAKIYLPAASASVPAAAQAQDAKPTSATAAVGTKRRADDDEQGIPSGPKAQRTSLGTSAAASSSNGLPPNPALQGLGMPPGSGPRQNQIGGVAGPMNGMAMGGAGRMAGPAGNPAGNGQRNQGGTELCRDYHTKGFCARGSNCKYIHSSDMIPMNGFQGMPGVPFGQPGPQGVPGMMGGAPGMPFVQNGGAGAGGPGFQPNRGSPAPGPPGNAARSEPHSLAARLSMASSQPPAMMPTSQGMPNPGAPGFGMPGFGAPGFGGPMPMMMMPPQQQQQQQQQMNGALNGMNVPHNNGPGAGQRGGFRGGRGGAGGGAGGRGQAGRFGNVRRSDTTLVIENVPQEHLDLIKINDYFKQFGTITNIQIDASAKKALLSYSLPEEAKTAHSNPDPIFGNRFIKVYFQRIEEEKPAQQGATASQSRPPPKQIFGGERSNVYVAPATAAAQAEANARAAIIAERKKLGEEQKAAQYALDLLRGESKTLMSKISAPNATEESKAEVLKRWMELEKEMEEGTARVRRALEALEAAPPIPPAPSAAPASGSGGGAEAAAKREEMERKRLDRELDMHAQGAEGKETPEELRAKLAKLQEEAASIGLDANGQPVASSSSFRGAARGSGFRGAYRGRGGFRGRGRGGSSMTFFNLDNRTTKVFVAPADGESWDAAKLVQAKQWAKSFGDVDSLDDEDSGFVATFKTRAVAEQALRSGASIPEVGSAKLSWVQARPGAGGQGSEAASVNGDAEAKEEEDLSLYES